MAYLTQINLAEVMGYLFLIWFGTLVLLFAGARFLK